MMAYKTQYQNTSLDKFGIACCMGTWVAQQKDICIEIYFCILQNVYVEFVNVIYQIAKCTFHAIAQQEDLYVF